MGEQMLTSPLVQWGFAGFCGVLVTINVWLIRELLRVLKENNDIIAKHTEVMREVVKQQAQTSELLSDIYARLLSRPCLKDS